MIVHIHIHNCTDKKEVHNYWWLLT